MSRRIEGIEENDLRYMFIEKLMTQQEIADHYGVSFQTILNRLKEFRIKRDGNFRIGYKDKIVKRDGEGCYICHRTDETYHIHHLIPRSRGGTNDIDNLVYLCATCHRYAHQDNLEKLIERAILNEDYY